MNARWQPGDENAKEQRQGGNERRDAAGRVDIL